WAAVAAVILPGEGDALVAGPDVAKMVHIFAPGDCQFSVGEVARLTRGDRRRGCSHCDCSEQTLRPSAFSVNKGRPITKAVPLPPDTDHHRLQCVDLHACSPSPMGHDVRLDHAA